MVKRCIKCKNLESRVQTSVSYHCLPGPSNGGLKWLQNLGIPQEHLKFPGQTYFVCSEHFDPMSITVTANGKKRLLSGTLPLVSEKGKCSTVSKDVPSTSLDSKMDTIDTKDMFTVEDNCVYYTKLPMENGFDRTVLSYSTLREIANRPLYVEGGVILKAEAEISPGQIETIWKGIAKSTPFTDIRTEAKQVTQAQIEANRENVEKNTPLTEIRCWSPSADSSSSRTLTCSSLSRTLSCSSLSETLSCSSRQSFGNDQEDILEYEIEVSDKPTKQSHSTGFRKVYVGDFKDLDLTNPVLARKGFCLAKKTIVKQRKKIKQLQQQVRRLSNRVKNIQSLVKNLKETKCECNKNRFNTTVP